jgi:ABC-type amino acid transport substrate-binding protein
VKDLDQALRDLRNLQADQAFVDPSNLAALQASALDKLKKFEFNLRKKAEGGDQPLALSGSDEVPAGFRTAIEEYYRALAKKQ